jgi:hypothetical protein
VISNLSQKVVGHKTDQKPADRIELFGLTQLRQKPCAVTVISKDQPPFIAAGADVVNGSWKLNPTQPRHGIEVRLMVLAGQISLIS